MNFSEKLIKLRKEKGLSQEELGYKINVSRQAVSKWESNQSKPEIEKLKEISNFFNVSIDYLLNDTNIENAQNTEQKNLVRSATKKLSILFILILGIYVITVIYKLIALSVLYNRANSFSEDNYWMNVNTEFSSHYNDKYNSELDISRDGNIKMLMISSGLNLDQTDLETPQYIIYIDKDNHIGYELNYDSNEKKYEYSNLDTDFDDYFQTNDVKEETLKTIENRFWFALNPLCFVSLSNEYNDECIKNYYFKDFHIVSATYEYDNVGLISNITEYYNYEYKTITYSYDYVPEHFGDSIISPLEDEDFNGKIIF